jgi:hypothetical protein
MLVKLSILLLYLRLFRASTTTRRLIYGGAAAITLFYTAFAVLQLALCHPRRGESVLGDSVARRCSGSWKRRFFAFPAFNIASDAYIVALPVRVVWRLQMDWRRKIAVTAVFVMGLLYATYLPPPRAAPASAMIACLTHDTRIQPPSPFPPPSPRPPTRVCAPRP